MEKFYVVRFELLSDETISVFFDKDSRTLNIVSMKSFQLSRAGRKIFSDLYFQMPQFVSGLIENHKHFTNINNPFIPPFYQGKLDYIFFYSLVYAYGGAMTDQLIKEGEIIASIHFIPLGLAPMYLRKVANSFNNENEIVVVHTKNLAERKPRKLLRVKSNLKTTLEDILKTIEMRKIEDLEEATKQLKEEIRKQIIFKNKINQVIEEIPEEVVDQFVEHIWEKKAFLSPYNPPHPLYTNNELTWKFQYILKEELNEQTARMELEKIHQKIFYRASYTAKIFEHEGKYYLGIIESIGSDR